MVPLQILRTIFVVAFDLEVWNLVSNVVGYIQLQLLEYGIRRLRYSSMIF